MDPGVQTQLQIDTTMHSLIVSNITAITEWIY